MKIHFLGTGTSTGIPEIGCQCDTCTSTDPKDKRLRTSALLEIDNKHILIDCGPDFRTQILNFQLSTFNFQLDGVLLTHEHYDHVGGLDDLRSFCRQAPVDIYAQNDVIEAIKTRMPYSFREHKYPGVPTFNMHAVENQPFDVAGVEVIPIRLLHGKLPILGFRIAKMAYLTDLSVIPESEYEKLKNLDVLIMNALRPYPHIAHQTLQEALENIKKIQPEKTYLIHESHSFGRHELIQKTLPTNVFIAYDGLKITLS
ncbi:MAG: MBL fold metallo-hydrolase [Dysgonamonadaceae bacterium]|jgi:phosphoribosyl 1,2-cyclic phosphate phosphodiesterase|nr:MBL fold metallo-hydrolase [Dysgonamonadaceae bacterium]